MANHGIGYADPDLLPGVVQSSGDALMLRRRSLDELHIRKLRLFFNCAVPAKGSDVSRRAASKTIATEIIQRTQAGVNRFPNLCKYT